MLKPLGMGFAKLMNVRYVNAAYLALLVFVITATMVSTSLAAINQAQSSQKKPQSSVSSAVFPVQGNVYPDGCVCLFMFSFMIQYALTWL